MSEGSCERVRDRGDDAELHRPVDRETPIEMTPNDCKRGSEFVHGVLAMVAIVAMIAAPGAMSRTLRAMFEAG